MSASNGVLAAAPSEIVPEKPKKRKKQKAKEMSFLDRLVAGAQRIASFAKSLLKGLKDAGAAVVQFVAEVAVHAVDVWARLLSFISRTLAEVVRRVAWLVQMTVLFLSLVLQTPSFIAIRYRTGDWSMAANAWSCFWDLIDRPSATGYVPSLSVVVTKQVRMEDEALADFLTTHKQAVPATA